MLKVMLGWLLAPLVLVDGTAATMPADVPVGAFHGVRTQGNDTVEVVAGPTAVTIVKADPATRAALLIVVEDGILRIGRRPDACRAPGGCRGAATIRVSSPRLTSVASQGSGAITGAGLTAPDLAIAMQGSGAIRLAALRATHVSVWLDGSGTVDLAGRTDTLAVVANGVGRLAATGLIADTASVQMNGGGTVDAHADRAATITANGFGSIRIEGTRDCTIARQGRADVVCTRNR